MPGLGDAHEHARDNMLASSFRCRADLGVLYEAFAAMCSDGRVAALR